MEKEMLDSKTKEYRSICFWSWNDKLEIEQLKEQIHWMCDKGIGGYFMHARSGLMTDYLSEEWMECIESCVKEGQELDMTSWLYDENGWPSGFVGGKLLENKQNCDKYILTQVGEYDTNATVSYLLNKDDLIRASSGEIQGTYLNLYIHTSVSTVDILNPDVVKQFLALTHEKYKQRFGEQFAEKIKGFFTDEPQYYRWHTPYTVMLETYWQEQFGEDILNKLGLLFVEKSGYREFRYRYWKAMQQLMLNSFAKLVYQWCDENGVKLTGHYIEETTMGYQMMCCGGIMPFYEYEHIPGIDWLGKRTMLELPAKQVGSVAAQLGKKQVLTESFGCCGWDVTPRDLRRIAGFQYVNGTNMTCQHLIPYSERGSRKYDHPAHYCNINPWVQEDFKTFNEYFARLGYFLGEGNQHVNVAMLHPIRSVYFDYKRELFDDGFGVTQLDESLQDACRTLSSRGIDYHFLDETLLEKYGFVEDNMIGCGKCRYEYLVLPTILTMDRSTESLLSKFVKQGGKILLLGDKPEYLEAEQYSYDYLESNISLQEIMLAQPYQVADLNTEIYSTYRTMGNEAYLYAINASDNQTQVQTYDFGPIVKSFVKVDLKDMSETIVPLTVSLKPGEDAFLYPSQYEVPRKKKLVPYELRFEKAQVSVAENYLPIDRIRYSKDGKEYSKPWPCAALFQKLLKERHQGNLYLRYEFDIEAIPERLCIRTEKSNDIAMWVNGKLLEETVTSKVGYENTYDITSYVHKGANEYTVQVDWYESEDVYFALFGENVTESLKNCIVYDTELQPVTLVGQFGVYPENGHKDDEDKRFVNAEDFYLGKMPEYITEPSVEGFPFLTGEIVLRQNVSFETSNILLRIGGDYHTASVKVNGNIAGALLFDKELDISDVAVLGKNEIEVRFLLGNRNLMGPHHLDWNKDDNVCPWSFELNGTWEEDKSERYHEYYDIKKIF